MGIFPVVRLLHVAVLGPVPGYSTGVLVAGAILTAAVLTGVALLGPWWARKTQAVFNTTSYFRRLPDEDQEAALALLDETVDARGLRSSAQPPP